jgi:hypothetical protein
LELFECIFKDHSAPDAPGWLAFRGVLTPVFTGARRDVNYHGWLDRSPLGRAKFTDGTLAAVQPYFAPSVQQNQVPSEDAQQCQELATSFADAGARSEERNARMEILFVSERRREPKPIPFWEALIESDRILDETLKKEWLDDAESRLRHVLSLVAPEPMLRGYIAERSKEGLTLYTISAKKVGRCEIGLLSAGEWPCWAEIVEAVPEFDYTHVVFDAVSRYEWFRRWDMKLQQHRIQAEHGVFG